MKKLIIIVGPTASGKSDLALSLAKKYSGEIICADSRTVYREMNIGTAKPYLNSQFSILNSQFGPIYKIEGIPHYMLDIANPDETFTAAQFQKMTYKIIDDILERDKIPLLVGGTGLYIDSIIKGFSIPKVAPNDVLRRKLDRKDCKILFQELKKIDPKAAEKIDRANKRRLIRALEVYHVTGKPFSGQQKIKKPSYLFLTLDVKIPREKLYERINERVDEQIKMGLVSEVKKLLKKGYQLTLPSMSGLGYKQIVNYLVYQKPNNLDEAIDQIKIETRHFAKRQITWFKKDKSIIWIENKKEAEKLIDKFLNKN